MTYTARSSASKFLVAVLSLALTASAVAGVNLDILNRCPELASVYVGTSRPVSSADCRDPATKLERSIFERMGAAKSSICLLRTPPSAFAGYTCIRPKGPGGTSITCIRPANLTEVEEYKVNADGAYSVPVANYLTAAKACPASNSDSAAAQSSQFPVELAFVSRFEFGFIVGMKEDDRFRSGAAVHGYAATEPQLAPGVPLALEFVSVYIGAPEGNDPVETLKTGLWSLEVQNDRSLSNQFNKAARDSGTPARLESTSFALTRKDGPSISEAEKLRLLEDFLDSATDGLESEGFHRMSEADLAKYAGATTNSLLRSVNERVTPYGHRAYPVVTGSDMRVLVSERRPTCTEGGNSGAIGAYLFAIAPIPDVKSDYGRFAVLLLRLGKCADSSAVTNRYARGLIEDATENVQDSMRSK